MSLTVFCGTFNPIHNAHTTLGEFVRKNSGADKLIYIPSSLPPHRDTDIAPAEHRFNMVKLAVKNNPNLDVSDIELKLAGKSYSYNTIQEIYRQNPDLKEKIKFIIGTDAFLQIENWYNYQEFVKIVDFIVLIRPHSADAEAINRKFSKKNINYKIVPAPLMEISSSLIRENIKNGLSVKNLVAKEVENYIFENNLYK